jgi:hypothetical protein
MEISKEQFKAANAWEAATIACGPIARDARYGSRRGLIVTALEGGCEFAFPAALAEEPADAPRFKLAKINISPKGLELHWPLLDAGLYVPEFIEGTFGSGRWMQQIGKLGGGVRAVVRAR